MTGDFFFFDNLCSLNFVICVFFVLRAALGNLLKVERKEMNHRNKGIMISGPLNSTRALGCDRKTKLGNF